MKKIILASKSPRRKEILEKIVTDFICIPSDIDESIDESKPLTEEIKQLSARKAAAILKDHPDAIVIGSDTVVVTDNQILGKPKDKGDAEKMIRMLSGKTHQVITGLCITDNNNCFCDVSVSNVTFRELTEEEIAVYLEDDEYKDKAGAYAIQGNAGKFITNIDGDYYAIMGLSLHQVYQGLKAFL